jgi:hypothetical protein
MVVALLLPKFTHNCVNVGIAGTSIQTDTIPCIFTQALLRAKALECISLVGMAVGRDRFRADAHEVMKFMQALQQQELDPDDPTGGYMLQVLALVQYVSHCKY